jgi:hypothetical protein
VARFTTIFAALLLFAAPARAAGVVSLTWDNCAGPLGKAIAPGTVQSLYLSVIGQTELHRAYQARINLGAHCDVPFAYGGVPDAWRFDVPGCETAALIQMDLVAPAAVSKACPSFMQSSAPSLQIKDYYYDSLVPASAITIANSYPNGVPSVDPNQRYFLARIQFDLTYAVTGPSGAFTCGGLETPMCFVLARASYENMGEAEVSWQPGNNCVSANDPALLSGCDVPTPARATTWGALRAQYR